MKPSLATLLLLFLGVAAAAAMPSPYEAPPRIPTATTGAIDVELSGAARERDYFRAPQPRYGAQRIFPCRWQAERVRSESCD
ncbi:MAG TPA: hypothetical protein VFA57_10875 [Pseudolabrys sp.]|nr:hypothetical protein [Pseudolabrys sp.]